MTITASQYAKKIGYSPASVTKRLQSQPDGEKFLPYATSVKKFGNTWMIELESPFPAWKARKDFKKNLVNSN